MILRVKEASAGACAECGTPASGNFCSSCGADLREGASGILGAVTGGVRHSVPATYLRILRSPIKATVALAEDPTYRQHISFFLSGLALFALVMVPFYIQSADPTGETAGYSQDMQTLMKVLSQAGMYVGAAIAFFLGFVLFGFFAKEPRSMKQYLKLYCLTLGFILPPYAVYDFVARGLLGGIGLSSFASVAPTTEQMLTVPFALSFVFTLLMIGYFIAIQRRFWRMPIWKASVLYMVAGLASYHLSFWLMSYAGYWVAYGLISAGVVTI